MESKDICKEITSLKITLLGKGAVGKTSLVYSFFGSAEANEYEPTIEDSINKIEKIDDKDYNLILTDTGGEEDYQNMMDSWITEGDGFMLVFALNDKQSFEALESKAARIQKYPEKNSALLLVGNKSDLKESREVTQEEIKRFAKKIKAEYIETCAISKDNKNVICAVHKVAKLIIKRKDAIFSNPPETLADFSDKKQGICCCNVY